MKVGGKIIIHINFPSQMKKQLQEKHPREIEGKNDYRRVLTTVDIETPKKQKQGLN